MDPRFEIFIHNNLVFFNFMDSSQGTPECERKFYVKGRQIDGDEDIFHEYKGHRNICQEELPMIVLSQGRRKAVSRCVTYQYCYIVNQKSYSNFEGICVASSTMELVVLFIWEWMIMEK